MTREEAIKEIKSWDFLEGKEIEAIQTLIPELAEREDERIRKVIVKYFKELHVESWINLEIPNILAWLEKQKEQFESGRGLYYYDGEKTTYMGYPATEENPYDFAISQQEKQKEQKQPHHLANSYYIMPHKEAEDEMVKLMLEGSSNPEQKPAEWSEEDKEILKDIISGLKAQKLLIYAHENQGKAQMNARIDWLQSLPERFNLQPKPEWSKEDEKIIDTIVSVLGQYIDYKAVSGTGSGYATPRYSKEIDWLKSLRPSWKPSEKQMKAVKHAYNSFPNDCPTKSNLRLLYYDLEKLIKI